MVFSGNTAPFPFFCPAWYINQSSSLKVILTSLPRLSDRQRCRFVTVHEDSRFYKFQEESTPRKEGVGYQGPILSLPQLNVRLTCCFVSSYPWLMGTGTSTGWVACIHIAWNQTCLQLWIFSDFRVFTHTEWDVLGIWPKSKHEISSCNLMRTMYPGGKFI